jgi:hypothetical protein
MHFLNLHRKYYYTIYLPLHNVFKVKAYMTVELGDQSRSRTNDLWRFRLRCSEARANDTPDRIHFLHFELTEVYGHRTFA